MILRYASFSFSVSRKQLLKTVRSFLLLTILVASTGVQTVSAVGKYDENFFSGNFIPFYNPDACKLDASGGTANLVGNSNAEKIWRFFVDKGLTAQQAAGVLGNIQAESGFDPGVQEKGSGIGFGIAQWSYGRRDQLEAAGGDRVADLAFQLDFLLQELKSRKPNTSNKNKPKYHQGYASEWDALRGQETIEDALVAFHNNFERSHLMNKGSGDNAADEVFDAVVAARRAFALNAFESFKGIAASGSAGTSADGAVKKPVVFLDPGHGAAMPQYIDPVTGLADRETDNGQETKDMLDVANRLKADLEKSNYTVILARTSNDAQINKRARVDAAVAAKADIAVSLHSDAKLNQVWYQRVGAYREYNGKNVRFENEEVAKKSQAYASAVAASRAENEGNQVGTDANGTQQASSFGGERVPSRGNISLVQLWASDIPWIYNEISRDVGDTGLSENRKNTYVKGISEGIKNAVVPTNTSECTSGGNFDGGNLQETTKAYAHPKYLGLTLVMMKAYEEAITKARGEGRYIGGDAEPGIDCGGFVTTLLVDSGFETGYNYGGKLKEGAGATPTQLTWVQNNRERVGSGNEIKVGGDPNDPKVLRAGDTAHLKGHTFVYVGEIPGFESVIASASLDERAPMAGKENMTASNTTWYRKKAPSTATGGSGQERL